MRPFKLLVVIGLIISLLIAGHSVFPIAYADIPTESTVEPVTATAEVPSATIEAATATSEPATVTIEPTQPIATATSEAATVVPPTATAIPVAATALPATATVAATATAQLVPTAAPPVPTVLSANGGPPVDRSVPLPDQPVAEAPLSLAQRISTSTAYIGMEVQYTIQVSGSQPGTAVEVRNMLPSELDVLSIVASAGVCSGGSQPVCQLILGEESAIIIIRARISNRAIPGSNLTAQAAAQDDAAFTAASDPIILAIVAAPSVAINSAPVNTAPTAVLNTGTAGGTSTNAGGTSSPVQPVQPSAPGVPAIPGQPGVVIDSRQPEPIVQIANDGSVRLPNGDLAPTGNSGDQTVLAVPALDTTGESPANSVSADPANILSENSNLSGSPAGGPQYAATKLPNTAATSLLAGWIIGLLGFAAIAYGLRRVRRAALLLDDQRLSQLEPLMQAMRRVMRQ